ncbi:ribonuclease H-like domain-containing protein [Mycotypha africana]|uniref:ribonuclease H-like domain-containing protein n=1 Tax=Mycotypha africana TaxID=64632 RepID=UPI002300E8F0|nr:ribonuclease H-like domain-containing protein [Mycotypha africana]KAI8968945.1 ribonuclease H-like domain-containing protein [Mycotypha africana]
MSAQQAVPDAVQDFQAFKDSLYKALISATNAANQISMEDYGFHRSLDMAYSKDLDQAGITSLSLGNTLLNHCALDCAVDVTEFEDENDVVDRYGSVIDVCDSLLEKADFCFDEMTGAGKSKEMKQTAPEITQIRAKGKLDLNLLHANNIIRPQLKFKDKIDNSNSTPFMRKIKYKPHALVPLDSNIESEDRSLPHPYKYEITHIEYPKQMFEIHDPEPYQPFDTTTATWVDNDETLKVMMDHLEDHEEIAVDLEHHNFRSYQGFTCLMQISTRDRDFIVDTLEIRDKLWQLNEYFANPNIVKVFHGADWDIQWLQRDFGLYVVNLFDTYFPTKVLNFPHHGLQYLLKKYCDFDTDKKYQLADWRIRPLPEEMLSYARSDTHFLLFIYDNLRNELLNNSTSADGNLVKFCLEKSQEVALRTYEKPVYDSVSGEGPVGWKNLLSKWKFALNTQQDAVFKALHSWRDHTARDEDESTRYVLPNHMLMTLVERMPTDSSGVIGCCNPCPPLVRMNAQALGYMILKAKMDALQVEKEEDAVMEDTTTATSKTANSSVTTAVHNDGAVTTTMDVQQVKRRMRHDEDPELFDLGRVKKQRLAIIEDPHWIKQKSDLFGDNW